MCLEVSWWRERHRRQNRGPEYLGARSRSGRDRRSDNLRTYLLRGSSRSEIIDEGFEHCIRDALVRWNANKLLRREEDGEARALVTCYVGGQKRAQDGLLALGNRRCGLSRFKLRQARIRERLLENRCQLLPWYPRGSTLSELPGLFQEEKVPEEVERDIQSHRRNSPCVTEVASRYP